MVQRDLGSGGLLLALSAVYYLGTRNLAVGRGEPGPAFFPILLSAALFIIGLAILVNGVRSTPGPAPRAKGEDQEQREGGVEKVWAAVAITVLYVWLFVPLGFVLSTLAYTFGVTFLFRGDQPRLLFTVPPLCTLVIYLFFRVGLGARLPSGLFG
jgi:hypothetical protein